MLFKAVIGILQASNRLKSKSVEAMVVGALLHDAGDIWKSVLSDTERDLVRSYMNSEKSLYLIKNKFSPSQMSEILSEVTKDQCPFRTKIPNYILVTMETITATSNFVTSLTPSAWLPVWPSSETAPKLKKKRISVLIESNQQSFNVLPAPKGVGIDMMPIQSSRAPRQIGVHIGPPAKPKKRIPFAVHGQSVFARMTSYFHNFIR